MIYIQDIFIKCENNYLRDFFSNSQILSIDCLKFSKDLLQKN